MVRVIFFVEATLLIRLRMTLLDLGTLASLLARGPGLFPELARRGEQVGADLVRQDVAVREPVEHAARVRAEELDELRLDLAHLRGRDLVEDPLVHRED